MDQKQNNEHKQFMGGYLAPKPAKVPANLEEVVRQAIEEHQKFHTNDGLSLYVWVAPKATGSGLHIYPISTFDEYTSRQIAQGIHAQRGLPLSGDWYLLFPSDHTNLSKPVLQ
jgi:hypothetical protein